jgi:hypothetical protein
MRRPVWLAVAGAVLVFSAEARAAAPSAASAPETVSVVFPDRPRGLTRVHGNIRPFFNLIGGGGGGIADLAIEHYFKNIPLKLGLELSPTAFAFQPNSKGAISHLRVEAALATRYLEVGLSAGGRMENFGPGGISLASRVRLGALDGLNLRLTYGHAIIRNYYSGQTRVAFSNVLATLEVPLMQKLALVVDGGFSFDVWMYGTIGLKHLLVGDGGPGSWIVRGGFGAAWVLDRFPCSYGDPKHCQGAAWGLGPTISLGVEHRF